MANRLGVLGRHYRFFPNCRQSYWAYSHHNVAAAKIKRHVEPEEMQVLSGEINYLGHVICPTRLEHASCTTDTTCYLKSPLTVMKLKSFWVLYIVYWRFVYNFPRIATPPSAKLKMGDPKQFDSPSTKKMHTLATLQHNLIAAPGPALPQRKGNSTL